MLDTCYWNGEGRYEAVKSELNKLVPTYGEVINPHKNPELERFRKASNYYYDLYNNGLMNYARGFSKLFVINASDYKKNYKTSYQTKVEFEPRFYEMVEEKMDYFILTAACEQKIISFDDLHNVCAAIID